MQSVNAKKGWWLGRLIRGMNMAARAEVCTASGVPLVEDKSTAFPCPDCGNSIGRSAQCRVQSVPYICTDCGFQGP